MRSIFKHAFLLMAGCAALASQAATPQDTVTLHMRALAATCANCHGTDGHTTKGSAIPPLAGMPRAYMVTQLKAFREGSRPATVMQQLTKGFTDEQIESVATYFAKQPR